MVKEQIAEKYEEMSKTQKRIANYILQNMTNVSYFNIQKLAAQVQTSEASILRFCTFLGYKGFPEFKAALQKTVTSQMGISERLKISYEAYDEKESGIAEIFRQDMTRIENTLKQLDMDVFLKACNELILAKKIYILAARSAAALGQFFQYYLNMTLGNVELITGMDCHADLRSYKGRCGGWHYLQQIFQSNGRDVPVCGEKGGSDGCHYRHDFVSHVKGCQILFSDGYGNADLYRLLCGAPYADQCHIDRNRKEPESAVGKKDFTIGFFQ